MKHKKSDTSGHVVSDINRQPDQAQMKRISDDPEMQARILRYQARKRRKQAKRRRIKRILLVLSLLIVFIVVVMMIIRGFRRDELKGIWALDQTTVYEFDGRGSGSLHLPLGDYAFYYTVEDKRLSIDFSDEQAADAAYSYSIDGSIMTLDNDIGSVFRLEKRK